MLKRLPSTLLLAGVVALSACGGTSSASTTVPADAGLVVTAVAGIAWDAKSYTAPAGDVKVALKNDSDLVHNLVLVDSTGTQLPSKIKVNAQGDVAVATIALKSGTYTVICTVPGHANMKSTLTVK